ncbi:MAG: low molecular weight phosphotyrosine protein phosphatase [Alloprevotella sp.]|nr:low molecular weight phosphotyrosine protein phosphatase [Alloprevotella sp.]
MTPTRILFVCLGNICRSAAADGIMQHLVRQARLDNRIEVDSAGTYGGHSGQLPDPRMCHHASLRGYDLTHRARKVSSADFHDFDLIVAMDYNNVIDLRRLAPSPEAEAKIVQMADFIAHNRFYDYVPDPYYEGAEGFELVLDMLEEGCQNLLEKILNGTI